MFSETGQPGESPEAGRKSRGTDDRGSGGTEKRGSHPATPEESAQARGEQRLGETTRAGKIRPGPWDLEGPGKRRHGEWIADVVTGAGGPI